MTVRNETEAWKKANELFPTDYELNFRATDRAGYDIYMSTATDNKSYICDLGDRLELNFDNGETVNIWIDDVPADVYEVTFVNSDGECHRITLSAVGLNVAITNATSMHMLKFPNWLDFELVSAIKKGW